MQPTARTFTCWSRPAALVLSCSVFRTVAAPEDMQPAAVQTRTDGNALRSFLAISCNSLRSTSQPAFHFGQEGFGCLMSLDRFVQDDRRSDTACPEAAGREQG